jgi:polyisoprenoid-binding protein YceI
MALRERLLLTLAPLLAPLLALPLLVAPAAAAAPAPNAPLLWAADAAKSSLEFQFVQAGASTTGRFARFTASIDFNPADLARARFDVAVDMASTDTMDKERDDTLRGPDLFGTATFPRATYVATQFAARGASFEAQGKLTLHGVTRDVPVSFSFQPGLDAGRPVATLKGTARIKRLAFGVGQGDWDSTEWVGDEVLIEFNLLLRPRATAPAIPATPAPAQRK